MTELTNDTLRDLLVRPGHVSAADFDMAREDAEKRSAPITDALVEKRLITDANLGRIIADGFGYKFVDLKQVILTVDLLGFIPEVVARSQTAVIFEKSDDGLKLATADPEGAFELARMIQKKTGLKVDMYYATSFGIEEAIKYYRSDIGARVRVLIQDLRRNIGNEENVVKLVDLFLEYAYDNRASDIHIEPLENEVLVRFRIDGVLHEAAVYPTEIHERIIFRIKIMSRLRTDEHAAPQDGRFEFKKGNSVFDVRVSVVPVSDGENIVMRILSEVSRRLNLEALGLLPNDLEKVRRAAIKPYGMILAVGPTGCGKTTTLYALLQVLNKPGVNITTIEDPIEYNVARVQQIAVNAKKGLTFATGLRSIVRQDPDIIMVGEIRDNETADIAINSAMTGHLVLSSMHTNDAATTFPRLADMDVEPFLIASSVNVVVAQRLVRKICMKCRGSYFLSEEELTMIKSELQLAKYIGLVAGTGDFTKIRFYKGGAINCKGCGGTGYSERIGIFEVMEIGEKLRPLITKKTDAADITMKAVELGMTTMLFDGIVKALQGITTLEEVVRAIRT